MKAQSIVVVAVMTIALYVVGGLVVNTVSSYTNHAAVKLTK